jgi:hypothetical protein
MTNKLQRRALELAFDAGLRVNEILELARSSSIELTLYKSAAALTLHARQTKELT